MLDNLGVKLLCLLVAIVLGVRQVRAGETVNPGQVVATLVDRAGRIPGRRRHTDSVDRLVQAQAGALEIIKHLVQVLQKVEGQREAVVQTAAPFDQCIV